MRDMIFLTSDELKLCRPSRTRYMELRRLLTNPKSPSIHITTGELANVVNGRTDITLPDWATNSEFEAELESFIANNSIVSVCWDCDSVLSFFHDKIIGKSIAQELAIVQQLEMVPCHYCGGFKIAFYDSKVLTIGEKVKPPDIVDTYEEPKMHADVYQKKDSRQISRNEKFLDELLRTKYSHQSCERSDVFNISESTIDFTSKKWAEVVTEWGKTPGLPILNPNELERFREKCSLSLRADTSGAKLSILRIISQIVKDILADDHPEFCNVAIAMAKSPGMTASVHLGDQAEMAVVIEIGLFSKLIRLNHLLSLIFDTDIFIRPDEETDWTIDDIVINIIATLTEQPINLERARIIPRLNYRTQSEFLRSNFITDAQIVFAILHELGHLEYWRRSPQLVNHSEKDAIEMATSIESWADAWAMDLIFKRGKEYFIPLIQYRSIFWLFEYWHLMAEGLHYSNMMYFRPRERWDHIESMIRRRKKHMDLEKLRIDEIRTIFSIMLNEMEGHCVSQEE